MNAKYLLPVVFLASTAHADLVPDSKAYQACKSRFESVNRSEGLLLRADDTYRSPITRNGIYHYFFNASSPGAEVDQRHYRVECRARRIGKVEEFALDRGRWVFEQPAEPRYAGRR